jgi:hypothetical protein
MQWKRWPRNWLKLDIQRSNEMSRTEIRTECTRVRTTGRTIGMSNFVRRGIRFMRMHLNCFPTIENKTRSEIYHGRSKIPRRFRPSQKCSVASLRTSLIYADDRFPVRCCRSSFTVVRCKNLAPIRVRFPLNTNYFEVVSDSVAEC